MRDKYSYTKNAEYRIVTENPHKLDIMDIPFLVIAGLSFYGIMEIIFQF